MLAQPIFTFGRASAGKRAAASRAEVERARLTAARNLLALEVRKLYWLHMYAKSMRPALDSASQLLEKARKKADEEYADNSGKVTNVDIQRLAFGHAELEKFRIQAEIGEDLALAAMKHTMGLPQNAPLVTADEMLPDPPDTLPTLAQLLKRASENRPEWTQIQQGKQAALSLEQSEKLANAPVVFLGGQFNADWTPQRPDIKNPYYYDPYNQVFGGIALGVLFDIDPWKASAKAAQARGLQKQVEGLEKFAGTGIPMEVRKAHDDAVQAKRIAAVAADGARGHAQVADLRRRRVRHRHRRGQGRAGGPGRLPAGQAQPLREPAAAADRAGADPLRHRRDRAGEDQRASTGGKSAGGRARPDRHCW